MNDTTAALIDKGLALHRGGATDEAAALYQEALRLDPTNADAAYYLAVIACRQGRFKDGIALARQALTAEPGRARTHNLLGMALHRTGRRDEALRHFDHAIAHDPALAEAHGNRGLVLDELGRYADALACYEQALAIDAGSPVAWCNRAIALRNLRRNAEALESIDRAIALRPQAAEYHLQRGLVLLEGDRLAEALAAFEQAVALNASLADAHAYRGIVLRLLDRFDDALASLDQAVALRPDEAGLIVSRANVLRKLWRVDDAAVEYARALAIDPNLAAAYLGSAILLLELGKFGEAREAVERARALDPEATEHPNTLAYLQLLQGEWEEGWRNYESRNLTRKPAYYPLPYPRWHGETDIGERLVVLTEQGMGDAIHFCRFAPMLRAHGLDVTVLTERPLARLLASLPGVKVTTSREEIERDPRPVRWVPMMSLPGLFGVRPQTVPGRVPYLHAEPERVAAWATRLGRDGFKVGLCWKSGPQVERISRSRDVPLAEFAPLADIPGVRLITLQLGPGLDEIANVPFRDRIERIDDGLRDWADTAAAMMNLDLIVSCDTSVPHLAGALARPTLLALPAVACWRWQLEREDSPWYPSLRLFRKTMDGDWSEVMARIAGAVRERMEAALLNPPKA